MARTLSERPRWEEMDKSGLPLQTAMEHYLTACRIEGKTSKTLFDYRCKLQRFVDWQGGTLADLELSRAREFVGHLQQSKKWIDHPGIPTSDKPLSAQTVAGHVRVMKGFATWIAEEEYTEANRLTRLAKPKLPSRLLEVLSADEVKRLLAACNPDTANGGRDLAIVTLFLDTGLRLNELVGISLDDVHLQDGWLKVFGKGEKERIVPFGTRTTKVLSRYLSFYRPEDSDTVAFFVNSDGSAITQNTIKMLFTRLRIRAKVPRVHPHLLRHTFATTYLMAGGDVFSLQAILGHTTLEMTRRYVNLASSHVAIQHKRFSPMDRLSVPGIGQASAVAPRPSARRESTPRGATRKDSTRSVPRAS